MKDKINTYFAILLVTIAGAGATMIIVRVASADVTSFAGSEAVYNASMHTSAVK